jgi:hypothetical protein
VQRVTRKLTASVTMSGSTRDSTMTQAAAKPSKRATAAPKPKTGAKGAAASVKPVAAPKKIGRPSKHTPELAAEICERLGSGEAMRQICRDEHMPHWTKVYEWLARDDALSLRVAHAREVGYDALAEESLEIIDGEPLALFDEAGNKRYDSGSIAWNKNRAEHRLKLLACWSPKRYGSRVALGGDPGNPVKVEVQSEADTYLSAILRNIELKKQVAASE